MLAYGPLSYTAPGWVCPRDWLRQPPPRADRGRHRLRQLLATLESPAITPDDAAPDVVAAIWDLVDATASLTSAFGKSGWLWINEAPVTENCPYAVIGDDKGISTYESIGGDPGNEVIPYDVHRVLTLTVYDHDRETALSLLQQILDVLDDAVPTFDDGHSGTVLRLRHEETQSFLDPDRGPDGFDIWQAVTTIEVDTSHIL